MLSSLREPPQKVTPLISIKSGVPRFTSVTYLQQLALPIACTHTARSAIMFETETHSITSSMFSCFTSVIRNTCNRNMRVKSSETTTLQQLQSCGDARLRVAYRALALCFQNINARQKTFPKVFEQGSVDSLQRGLVGSIHADVELGNRHKVFHLVRELQSTIRQLLMQKQMHT
jgi:hypothetical protein